MAKTKKKKSVQISPQAHDGAWTPNDLLDALKRGTKADRIRAMKTAGIIDSKGNVTSRYKSWGNKVTRTMNLMPDTSEKK